MVINIKLHKDGVIPKKAHKSDACYDIVATSIEDLGNGIIKYGLGISLQPSDIDSGVQFDFRPRSSIYKTGMVLANSIGTGDENFTGEYSAIFYNLIPSLPNYKVGDRIIQMQVTRPVDISFNPVEDLQSTDRGSGGYGSTGA